MQLNAYFNFLYITESKNCLSLYNHSSLPSVASLFETQQGKFQQNKLLSSISQIPNSIHPQEFVPTPQVIFVEQPAHEQQNAIQGSNLLFQSQMKAISNEFKVVKMDRGTVLSQMNLNNDAAPKRGRGRPFKDPNAPRAATKLKNENLTPKKKGAGGGAGRGSKAKKALLDQ